MIGWGEPAPRGSSASHDEYVAFLASQSRLRQWRARSRTCAVIDAVVVAAGAAVCAITAVDVASTWQDSRAWLDHQHLSVVMGAILIPAWPWLIASIFLVSPTGRTRLVGQREHDPEAEARRAQNRMLRRNMYPGRRARLVQIAVAVLAVALIVAALASGAAKGSGDVLPGPHYRIQTSGLDDGGWTDVTAAQYAYWQARFVRLDSFFALFGAFMVFWGLGVLRLHRTAAAASAQAARPARPVHGVATRE